MEKEKRNGELLEQPAESLTITKTAADQKEQLRL